MPVEQNPFDDERLAKIRAEQGDPIVQYYIVRTDLQMSTEKVGAQIAHGAQMFILGYQRVLDNWIRQAARSVALGGESVPRPERIQLVQDWLDGSFRKVVLGGKQKDFERIKAELSVFLVR